MTTWLFGDDLAIVFLPGEVVVDYALRLKRELDGRRLWITAYANGVPCYVVSRRVLQEGGYEPEGSMLGYGWPAHLAPSVDDRIVETAKSLLPKNFTTNGKKSTGRAERRARDDGFSRQGMGGDPLDRHSRHPHDALPCG